MIIYRQYQHEGAPVYQIITKTFQHVSIKCDDSFSDTEIFKLLSLLQDDIDHMKVS
ncbi:TPA: C1q-binding complement inhibitor VraX [Staphylococcus aureus]|nr:C1q-binding complement inhibitor VraX [Staphylococcus aureus]